MPCLLLSKLNENRRRCHKEKGLVIQRSLQNQERHHQRSLQFSTFHNREQLIQRSLQFPIRFFQMLFQQVNIALLIFQCATKLCTTISHTQLHQNTIQYNATIRFQNIWYIVLARLTSSFSLGLRHHVWTANTSSYILRCKIRLSVRGGIRVSSYHYDHVLDQ